MTSEQILDSLRDVRNAPNREQLEIDFNFNSGYLSALRNAGYDVSQVINAMEDKYIARSSELLRNW